MTQPEADYDDPREIADDYVLPPAERDKINSAISKGKATQFEREISGNAVYHEKLATKAADKEEEEQGEIEISDAEADLVPQRIHEFKLLAEKRERQSLELT
ncbi:hypothetical protein, partial [Streptococcus pyogenes]